ncbi:hypothetical protein EC973_003990 [Apophysomyces ossiformis]|uniref:MYND-type domain-containing protein n=1 Tax=Apophysomyces ossiformis TaxID=679940 RepID=A0A8H7BVB7_9FUNG|nr:hypothetical protein EC973_003990 [Apophysomyces ossiformis]
MPSLLFSRKPALIEKNPLASVLLSTSQVNVRHDVHGCFQCAALATRYLQALDYVKKAEPILCNGDLLELVWRMTHLVLEHRETRCYQALHWFDQVTQNLWDFAKRLKDEAMPTMADTEQENYRRAVQITIYSCRALIHQQIGDIDKAIGYYRKCTGVRPCNIESQTLLQQSALVTLDRLIADNPTPPPSSASSVSSQSSSVSCASCGVERRAMPVCARCRYQTYCSAKCLKAHKPIHDLICGQ